MVMPPVTGCTLPAVTAHVREAPPSLIPEGAEAQPPTTAATPVIIPMSPAAVPLPMKPDAHAGLIPVLTAAAAPVPVVLLVHLPLLPAQAARLHPPAAVLLLVPGVLVHLLHLLRRAALLHLLRRAALLQGLLQSLLHLLRRAALLQVPLLRGAAALPVEVLHAPDRLLLAEVIKRKNLPAKIVRERLTIPARTNQPAPLFPALIRPNKPEPVGLVPPAAEDVPTAQPIPAGTAAIQLRVLIPAAKHRADLYSGDAAAMEGKLIPVNVTAAYSSLITKILILTTLFSKAPLTRSFLSLCLLIFFSILPLGRESAINQQYQRILYNKGTVNDVWYTMFTIPIFLPSAEERKVSAANFYKYSRGKRKIRRSLDDCSARRVALN